MAPPLSVAPPPTWRLPHHGASPQHGVASPPSSSFFFPVSLLPARPFWFRGSGAAASPSCGRGGAEAAQPRPHRAAPGPRPRSMWARRGGDALAALRPLPRHGEPPGAGDPHQDPRRRGRGLDRALGAPAALQGRAGEWVPLRVGCQPPPAHQNGEIIA